MLAWMLYVVMVTSLLSIGAFVAERAARLKRGRTRWIWITAIVASLAIPTVIASVSVELPNVVTPAVAQKVVVLREVTTQALSPVMWISGSAVEPHGWRDFDALLTTLWRAASGAMLLALIASGAHLFMRKRRWDTDVVAGSPVYVTRDVGPAVVGLLRPRIVVPTWVTVAVPSHQSAVIAHEQSHLDARDPQLFTFALALLVFMPWNLPLWWQLRRLRYAIEVDCDARVLEGGIDPTHYGETLIAVGERQSVYIGAVAAMSESRSFLEERLRIMLSKPVKWRRVGIAALAGVSLALTALAAQVSPPNVNSADSSDVQGGGPTRPSERVAIKLPAATLDRYVGAYKMNGGFYIDVKRTGEQMIARGTGQTWFEIYPERENYFFWKAIDAQLEFADDGTGAVTLHLGGMDRPLQRVDPGESAAAQTALDERIANKIQQPGTEAALRRTIDAYLRGSINYEDMEAPLANVTRQQEAGILATMKEVGPIQSFTYKGVSQMGWDMYEVKFAKATFEFRIVLDPGGKITAMMMTEP
jgi:bla regulator protein BlaR1